MGAALLQRMPGDKSLHPVAFFSRKLNQAQQNYSASDREMLAIVEALRFWRHLLHGLEFKVRTDHKPLSSFFTQPNLSGRQLRWAERLSEFLPGASLHYKSGRENLVPDALSRRPDFLTALKHATEDGYPLAFCNSVASVESSLLSRLAVTQERDSRWGEYAHLAGSRNGQW